MHDLTFYSLIAILPQRYGDIALNPSCSNKYQSIQKYKSLINRVLQSCVL